MIATYRDRTFAFIRKELRSFINDAVRPRQVAPAPQGPDEGKLIERAGEGAQVRTFLESPVIQDFMARQEAQLMSALISLPLEDDAGRRNLAVAIQTQRQLVKYMAEAARDGRAAEAELERLAKGSPARAFF